jgi:hypothetical protein
VGTPGWKLGDRDRDQLLERFPARYPDVVADHVTGGSDEVPAAREGRIVGRTNDDAGVEALVVEIAGRTDRPDGSTYHITWSLDRGRGRDAVESNDVFRTRGWRPVPAVAIALAPTDSVS